ncbi:MAG TPA: hypothetical protein VI790_02440, partial [Candidatus Nanoarchaeia archaeon]|nr:hypothetical protein [Candidatus Nanoarchaeia archaeon]
NDFDGDTCAVTTRTDPSSAQTCYYNRQCLTSGCNLSSAGALRINYCDYCSLSGTVSGDYSPALNATCASNCPNSGVRYYDDTVTRSDDCLNGAEQILTESYQTGYVYTSQTAAGICSNTECDLDCGAGYVGTCISSTCTCSVETINYTVFFEDFTPSPYYNYNWTRLGTNWDSLSGGTCYGGSGSCAHADGTCTEAGDNIQTITSLIDLTGANNAYFEFYVREDTSFDNNDWLRVWCYTGSTWNNFYQENTGDWASEGTWRNRITSVPVSCQTNNAQFRITIISNSNQEDIHIDDIKVVKEI